MGRLFPNDSALKTPLRVSMGGKMCLSTWLTFQFGAGDRVHVERYQLKQSVRIDGDWRDVKQSPKLFEHLDGASLKRFHSGDRKRERKIDVMTLACGRLKLTRFEWWAFLGRAKTKSQNVCSALMDPFLAAPHRRCSRHGQPLMDRVELFYEHDTPLQGESRFPFLSCRRSGALSLSDEVDSSLHVFADWTRTAKRPTID